MPAPYVAADSKRKYQRSSTMSDDTLPLAFSGWIHVAVSSSPNGKKKFKKRYCKLRDVVCTFYDAIGQKAKPEDKHMILTVTRQHAVNQGILLKNHKDQYLNMYTEVADDYQMWYSAFEEALNSARRSEEVRSRSLRSIPSIRNSSPEESLAKLQLGSDSDDASSVVDGVQERSIWMQKETTAMFATKMKRRYFVLNGNHLSYFDVNMEGRRAEGSGYVSAVKVWENTPNGLEIELDSKKKIRVATKKPEEAREWHHYLRSVCQSK